MLACTSFSIILVNFCKLKLDHLKLYSMLACTVLPIYIFLPVISEPFKLFKPIKYVHLSPTPSQRFLDFH